MPFAFNNTAVATVYNTETGIAFTMRLVRIGDGYGRNLDIVHTKNAPLVEFYDARYADYSGQERGGEFGQFVSRYYVDTLLAGNIEKTGIVLDGGVAAWAIDPNGGELIRNILRNWLA